MKQILCSKCGSYAYMVDKIIKQKAGTKVLCKECYKLLVPSKDSVMKAFGSKKGMDGVSL